MDQNTRLECIEQQLQDVEKVETGEGGEQNEKVEKLRTHLLKLEKDLGALKNDGTKLRSHVDFLEGSLNYDKQIEGFKQKIERLEVVGQKVKKPETGIKKAEKLETVAQKIDNMGQTIQKIEGLHERLEKLESLRQSAEKPDTIDQRIVKLEESTDSLSSKIDKQDASLQELAQSLDVYRKDLENSSSFREKDLQQFQDVQKRLTVVERKKNALKKLRTKFGDLEGNYKMVCQIIANRLAPLEQLRDIFKKNLKTRDENLEKLAEVVKGVSAIMPKLSHLETLCEKHGIGITVNTYQFSPIQGEIVHSYKAALCNVGSIFDSSKGLVTVPVDGLYGLCFTMMQYGGENVTLKVCKTQSCSTPTPEADTGVIEGSTRNNGKLYDSVFTLLSLKAGDSLYVWVKSATGGSALSVIALFTCFLIR